jgi:oxalate decarboxylase
MASAPKKKQTVDPVKPIRGKKGADIIGPRNPAREAENPDRIAPPNTDHGTLPNLKWSFADSHNRLEEGGWARQTTIRELPISKEIAGVNMRLTAGAVREMHWHKEGEWAYMLKGSARITVVDQELRAFQDDIHEGEGWYFPTGIPHSIQALGGEGCEFLLVFDDGNFNEDATFGLTDWLSHTPKEVLAKNFNVSESALANLPKSELYIFHAEVPGPLAKDRIVGLGKPPHPFSHKMIKMKPTKMPYGQVRILDSTNFPISTTIAAALVEVEPGGMRELHWHPNADEWQYFLSGTARMTVFASGGDSSTFDYQAGDVGYVPRAMGHYVENTGKTTMRFLEMFKAPKFEDVPLAQWLAFTPHELVRAHLRIDEKVLAKIPKRKLPIVGKS